MGHEEKRAFFRRSFSEDERYLIEYKIGRGLFKKKTVALTINISAGGCLFRAHELIGVNTVMNIWLTLPGTDKPIPIEGKVVRVEPTLRDKIYHVAIHYTKITDLDQDLLNKFCKEERSPQAAPSTPQSSEKKL